MRVHVGHAHSWKMGSYTVRACSKSCRTTARASTSSGPLRRPVDGRRGARADAARAERLPDGRQGQRRHRVRRGERQRQPAADGDPRRRQDHGQAAARGPPLRRAYLAYAALCLSAHSGLASRASSTAAVVAASRSRRTTIRELKKPITLRGGLRPPLNHTTGSALHRLNTFTSSLRELGTWPGPAPKLSSHTFKPLPFY